MPDFLKALETFFEGCQRIHNNHLEKHFPNLKQPPFRMEELNIRWRIIREGSVHAFVDKKTGDVLMPASWSKPAKHARGNIFEADNGLGRMGPYGPQYLR